MAMSPHSPRATETDGRNVDATLGALEGEAAGLEVKRSEQAVPARIEPLAKPPADATLVDYYGLPAIKEPVWISTIPAYFYTGGLAGASLVLGAAVQLAGRNDRGARALVRRCRFVGFGATVVSSALLISDLGRPSRFLNMLRVFRPTSPMSVGSWVLAATGAFSTASLLPGVLGDAPALVAGVLGMPLAGYTAVLIANTAVPIWQSSRRALPFLFVAGAVASAGAFLDFFDLAPVEASIVRRFGIAGKCGELVAAQFVEREAERAAPRVADPLRSGPVGALWTAAKLLTGASLVVSLLPGRSRWKRAASGLLGTLGSLATRFAIFRAGKLSARDPHATFEMQRAT